MMAKFSLIALLGIAVGCMADESTVSSKSDPVFYVSLVSVVTAPSKYVGKRIAVVGYLSRDLAPFLYLSKEHSNFNDIVSGVSVHMREHSYKSCLNQYVRISGRFLSDGPGEYMLVEVSHIWVYRENEIRLSGCLKDVD